MVFIFQFFNFFYKIQNFSVFFFVSLEKTPKEFGNSWELREFLHHDVRR